jgi:hypothetical protein
MLKTLQQLFPDRIISPETKNDLSRNNYMVYILTFNSNPIVVGHGKKNRAKIIFDSENQITTGHLKSIFVRLYNLYGEGYFERFIINCTDKEEAKEIEKKLHRQIGGNNRNIPENIKSQLLNGLENSSIVRLTLEIALCSSFDGISDLKKWRAEGILNDEIWNDISERLRLHQ